MSDVHTIARLQQSVVVAMVFLTGVLFWRSAADPFQLPKGTVVGVGGVLLALLLVARASAQRRVDVPKTAVVWLLAGFVFLLVVTTATSTSVATSVAGEYRYYAGLVGYGTYVLVALTVLQAFDERAIRLLGVAALASLGVVLLYGLVQLAGADPYDWQTSGISGVFSTLGQPNFAAGYVGILVPATVGVVLMPSVSRPQRLGAAVLVVVGALVAVATRSFQGPVTLASGSAFVLAAWSWTRRHRLSETRRRIAVRAAVGAGVLVVAALVLAGPFLRDQLLDGLEERTLMWEGAASMIADRPLVGTGPDTFGLHFPEERPAEHAIRFGFTNPEEPHNVPLAMAAGGGLGLGAVYLSVVAFTGWALVRGLARTEGARRDLLIAVGGAWVGYQTQSLVSIDVPSIAILHWAAMGGILTLARPALPTAARARPRRGRRRVASTSGGVMIAQGVAAVVAVVALVYVTRPIRADIAGSTGFLLARSGQEQRGLDELQRAAQLASYRSPYWLLQTGVYRQIGNLEAARGTAERAASVDFGSSRQALLNAELAVEAGDGTSAERWYAEAVERDPNHPAVLEAAATYFAANGSEERAATLRERLVQLSEVH